MLPRQTTCWRIPAKCSYSAGLATVKVWPRNPTIGQMTRHTTCDPVYGLVYECLHYKASSPPKFCDWCKYAWTTYETQKSLSHVVRPYLMLNASHNSGTPATAASKRQYDSGVTRTGYQTMSFRMHGVKKGSPCSPRSRDLKWPDFLRFNVNPQMLFAGLAAISSSRTNLRGSVNRNETRKRNVELLTTLHQFVNFPDGGLDMIDNKFVEISGWSLPFPLPVQPCLCDVTVGQVRDSVIILRPNQTGCLYPSFSATPIMPRGMTPPGFSSFSISS